MRLSGRHRCSCSTTKPRISCSWASRSGRASASEAAPSPVIWLTGSTTPDRQAKSGSHPSSSLITRLIIEHLLHAVYARRNRGTGRAVSPPSLGTLARPRCQYPKTRPTRWRASSSRRLARWVRNRLDGAPHLSDSRLYRHRLEPQSRITINVWTGGIPALGAKRAARHFRQFSSKDATGWGAVRCDQHTALRSRHKTHH
jgi:hypothetical protein